MATKKTQSKSQNSGPTRYANSGECEACLTRCVRGKAFLEKLETNRKANCPLCVLK